jgi:hypothetical protein
VLSVHRTLIIGLIVVATIVQSSCGGGDARSAARSPEEREAFSADAPAPEDGTLDPGGPYIGAWTAELTLDDLANASADTRYRGTFRLELREDGTYEMQQGDVAPTTNGQYRAAPGDFLVFTDDTGCDFHGSFSGTGVYRWSVDGDELTLTLVRPESGGCTGRSDTLIYPRWQRA